MLEENSLFSFFKKHGLTIGVFIALLTFGCIFTGKKLDRATQDEKNDCFRAQQLFAEMQMGRPLSKESLDEIAHIIKRHPFLAPKYEPLIALSFISLHNAEEELLAHMGRAMHHYRRNKINRVLDEEIVRFNEISLLITKKEYPQAIEKLKDLNLSLEKKEACASLYACSLLRTLFLAEKTNDLLLAKITWDKLTAHPIWPEMASLFYENNLTLQDYFNQGVL